MSKEKQIEQVQGDIKVIIHDTIYSISNEDDRKYLAEILYAAGYRKQSEGRWTPRHKDTKAFCTKCGALRDIETQEFWSFCPNCGAKMKGGSE